MSSNSPIHDRTGSPIVPRRHWLDRPVKVVAETYGLGDGRDAYEWSQDPDKPAPTTAVGATYPVGHTYIDPAPKVYPAGTNIIPEWTPIKPLEKGCVALRAAVVKLLKIFITEGTGTCEFNEAMAALVGEI